MSDIASWFKPLGDRIVIEHLEDPENTTLENIKTLEGLSLVTPETAKTKSAWGRVVAAGPGDFGVGGIFMQMRVSVGDEVLVMKYSGTEFHVDGVPYLCLSQKDILGVRKKS